MEFNQEELINQLYADSLSHSATIRLLKDMFIGYVAAESEAKANALRNFFDEWLPKYHEEQILNSPMKSEYLEKMQQDALKKFRDLL